jgi:multicomponent Na+:H+ antiporter subunit F
LAELTLIIFYTAFYILLAGLVLATIRFLKGPTSADRVVALDGMTIIGISLIVFFAYLAKRVIYLDVALVYALLSFLGVIAVARYLEGGL